MVPDGRATKLSLRTIKIQASAIASEHIANLSNEDAEETYIVRAKAIDFLFHELYQMRTAFDHDNPASVIQKALGSMIEILLWHRTLLSTAEDLDVETDRRIGTRDKRNQTGQSASDGTEASIRDKRRGGKKTD